MKCYFRDRLWLVAGECLPTGSILTHLGGDVDACYCIILSVFPLLYDEGDESPHCSATSYLFLAMIYMLLSYRFAFLSPIYIYIYIYIFIYIYIYIYIYIQGVIGVQNVSF